MKQLILFAPLFLVITACNTSTPESISQAALPVSVETEVISSPQEPTPSSTPVIPTATVTSTPTPTIQATNTPTVAPAETEKPQLKQVSAWSFAPDGESALQLIESEVDLVVFNFDPQVEAVAEVISQLQQASRPKLVLAYLNVGQADAAQSYWQPDWQAGNPWWLIESNQGYANNNVPVAYWNDDYRHIWLADDGYLQAALEAGFDGIYVDGIEACADEAVITYAESDGAEPQQEMIWLLGDMIDFVKSQQPDFMVVAHNAAELMTRPEAEYVLETLDGLAQERNWSEPPISKALAAAASAGKTILTINYNGEVDDADQVNKASRALDFVPLVSEDIVGRYELVEGTPPVETEPVTVGTLSPIEPVALPPRLAGVKSFLYQLQNINLEEVGQTGYDLVVMDYSADGADETAYNAGQIESLRHSPGGKKIILAYMSIGEAEDYRFYWQPGWDADRDGQPNTGAPVWLDAINPDWAGNYKVRYWEPTWQAIIFDYTDKLIDAGFDGTYLDIVDAFEYYEAEGRTSAAQEMADFVAALAAHARRRNPDFLVFPQNGSRLAALTPSFLDNINGIGQESTYYGYNGDDLITPLEATADVESYLDLYKNAGKLVLTIDYATTPAHIDDAYAKSLAKGYVPFVTVRELDALTTNPGHEPD